MPIIEFEGLADDLIPGVQQLTKNVTELRSEVNSTNDAIRRQASESIAAEKRLGDTIEATAQKMSDLNRESAKAAESQRSIETAAKGAQSEITQVGGAFGRIKEGIRQFAIGARDGFRTTIKEAGGLRGILDQVKSKFVSSSKESKTAVDTVGLSITQLKAKLDAISKRRDSLVDPKSIAKANGDIKILRDRIQQLQTTTEKTGGAFKGVADGLGDISGQVPVIGGLLQKMGPLGIAISGIAAGLLQVVKNTDAGATAIDGFGRTGGLIFDRLTGSVKSFVNGLTDMVGRLDGDAIPGFLKFSEAAKGLFAILAPGQALFAKIFGNEVEEGQRLAQIFDDLQDKQREVNLANADAEVVLAGLNQKLRDRTKSEQERLAIADQITAIERNRARQEQAFLTEQVNAQRRVVIAQLKSKQEIDDKEKDRLAELEVQLKEANARSINLTETVERRRNAILEEGSAERVRLTEQERRAREQSLNELAKLEEDLARRSAQAAQQVGDPTERLNAQKQQQQKELDLLEQKLREANAAIGRGNKLTETQEQQLADARLAIQIQYDKDRTALELSQASERLALIEDTGAREQAEFELQLQESLRKLEEAGADYIELARFAEQQRARFAQEQVNSAIDVEERIALAKIDAIQKGAETEEQYRIRIELLRLQTQEEFARQRLENIAQDGTKEAELTKVQLEAVLAEIERKRTELRSKTPDIDIFSLLGINLDDAQRQKFIADLQTIGSAVEQAVVANVQAQQAGVQAQIEATNQIIDDQRSRRDSLIALLDEELEAQRNGYANNADAVRAQIDAVTQAENDALENRKKLQEEQKRLAQVQARIESAQQVAALLTANAYLLKDGALKGIPGTIAAIAFAVSLISTFASIRARAQAAASDVPQFERGGEVKTGHITGPLHEAGGVALLDRRTGRHFATAEGGEFMVNRESARKYRKTLDAINEGDFARMQRAAIEELLSGTGVTMRPEKAKEFVGSRQQVESIKVIGPPSHDKAILRELESLRAEVASFRSQEVSRPVVSGNSTITPSRTVVKR